MDHESEINIYTYIAQRIRTLHSGSVESIIANSPGIVSGSPYTNSADDECKSSLGVTLKLNRTHGRSSIQLSPDSLAFNADFNVRWKRSTIPLACG